MLKFFSSLALNALQFLPLLIHKQQTVQPDAAGPTKEQAVLDELSTVLNGLNIAGAVDLLVNPAKAAAIKKLIAAIVTFKNELAAADAAVAPTPPTV